MAEDKILNLILDKLDAMDSRFIDLEKGQQGIISRLDELERKVDKLEIKVDKLESKVDKLEMKVDKLQDETEIISVKVNKSYENFRNHTHKTAKAIIAK